MACSPLVDVVNLLPGTCTQRTAICLLYCSSALY